MPGTGLSRGYNVSATPAAVLAHLAEPEKGAGDRGGRARVNETRTGRRRTIRHSNS
nr:hypothetical protein KitaXyl93_73540 [Kitasatospora sp. Xyl93]